MPIPSNLSLLGIAKETTAGTAAPATAFLPVTEMKPHVNVAYLDDMAMRASQAALYNEVLGVAFAEYEFSGPAFADTVGFALTGVLGDVATTGASAPYSHAISLNNAVAQTPTYTLSDYNGVNTRQFAGARFSDVAFKFGGSSLLEYTAKAVARTYATTTKPTASYSAVTAPPAWQIVTSLAGSTSMVVVEGDMTIKRTVAPIHNVDGSQTPYDIYSAGDLSVEGSLKAVYEDDTIYGYYLNGTPVALDLNLTNGTGAGLTQIKMHASTVQLTDCTVTRSASKYVEIEAKYVAIANSTDKGASGGLSPLAVTLQNALASGTYK